MFIFKVSLILTNPTADSMNLPSITKRNKVHLLAERLDGWMDGFTIGYWCCHRLDDDSIKMPQKIQQYATIHPALPTTENGESTGQILPDKQILSRYPSVLP